MPHLYPGLPETPPRARGRPTSPNTSSTIAGNTPACAGKTGSPESEVPGHRKHPRMRGEYGIQFNPFVTNLETPPRARGRPPLTLRCYFVSRNTPACAGKTLLFDHLTTLHKKHPRVRGEDFLAPATFFALAETPPRARGRRFDQQDRTSPVGNTPAWAGKTI